MWIHYQASVLHLTLQYHYNSQTGQYCYYDASQQTYIAVDSEG